MYKIHIQSLLCAMYTHDRCSKFLQGAQIRWRNKTDIDKSAFQRHSRAHDCEETHKECSKTYKGLQKRHICLVYRDDMFVWCIVTTCLFGVS